MPTTLWIYIWRFQPFHNGHKRVVEQMLHDNNQENIIILGSLEQDTERNIYSPQWRTKVIQQMFPNIDIQTLADVPSDTSWVLSLKQLLDRYQIDTYTFYCGDKEHDSAIQNIQKHQDIFEEKNIHIKEIPRNIVSISGTWVRKKMQSEGKESIEQDVPKEVYEKIQNEK